MEIIEGIDTSKLTMLTDKRKAVNAETNNNIPAEEITAGYDELIEAKKRLKLLEMKIQTLENRLSKKYPDVFFLNYKNRKRILVSARNTDMF